jgi:hypothetical protein
MMQLPSNRTIDLAAAPFAILCAFVPKAVYLAGRVVRSCAGRAAGSEPKNSRSGAPEFPIFEWIGPPIPYSVNRPMTAHTSQHAHPQTSTHILAHTRSQTRARAHHTHALARTHTPCNRSGDAFMQFVATTTTPNQIHDAIFSCF